MNNPGAVSTTQCIDRDICAHACQSQQGFQNGPYEPDPLQANGNSPRFGQISVLILVLPPVRQGDCCGGQMPVAPPTPHLHHGLMLSTLKTRLPTEPGRPRRARHIPQRGERFCMLRVKTRGQRELM
jgi:hypothetical protein